MCCSLQATHPAGPARQLEESMFEPPIGFVTSIATALNDLLRAEEQCRPWLLGKVNYREFVDCGKILGPCALRLKQSLVDWLRSAENRNMPDMAGWSKDAMSGLGLLHGIADNLIARWKVVSIPGRPLECGGCSWNLPDTPLAFAEGEVGKLELINAELSDQLQRAGRGRSGRGPGRPRNKMDAAMARAVDVWIKRKEKNQDTEQFVGVDMERFVRDRFRTPGVDELRKKVEEFNLAVRAAQAKIRRNKKALARD
jgi:hypothetical protein